MPSLCSNITDYFTALVAKVAADATLVAAGWAVRTHACPQFADAMAAKVILCDILSEQEGFLAREVGVLSPSFTLGFGVFARYDTEAEYSGARAAVGSAVAALRARLSAPGAPVGGVDRADVTYETAEVINGVVYVAAYVEARIDHA